MNVKTTLNNLYERIASAGLDEAVGIRLAYLTGDDEFSLYGAEIGPYKRLAAHYHKSGIEIYQIVEGNGTMFTGNHDCKDNVTTWNKPLKVKKGDCFTIIEGEAHQLLNNSDSNLVVIFGSPKSHLSTDRIVVNGYE